MPVIVSLSVPGLIESEDSLVLREQPQHLDCELLPHVLVPQRVGILGNPLHLLELELFVLLDYILDQPPRNISTVISHDILFNLLN